MVFDTNAPFPEFWFETNLSWGNVTSIAELRERVSYYLEIGSPSDSDIIRVAKHLKRAGGVTFTKPSFGTRREHREDKTLYDFLVDYKVLVEEK